MISYSARPSGAPAGGILVVHENRGLTGHIKDVVRRVATAGFTGLSVDVLSRDGGADKVGVTGFCFGGGMVWNTLAAGVSVKAAVPFYGPATPSKAR